KIGIFLRVGILKEIKPVIIQAKNTVQHIDIPGSYPAPRIVLLLTSLIIFRSYVQHIIENIVKERIFIAVMRIKRNSAYFRSLAQLRDGYMFEIFLCQHGNKRFF